eukprot:m51a1_g866 hypothetical protein (277) ;mRNA; r:818092-819362
MAVIVHVYDLAPPLNAKLRKIGLGLYHSGIELTALNKEFWFQGHPYGFTGVIGIDHTVAANTAPLLVSLHLGETADTPEHLYEIIDELTDSYRGNTYHPIRRNCNAFSEELLRRLHCPRMPGFVNRLARMGQGLLRVFPEKWLWWIVMKLIGAPPPPEQPPAAGPGPAPGGPVPGTPPQTHRAEDAIIPLVDTAPGRSSSENGALLTQSNTSPPPARTRISNEADGEAEDEREGISQEVLAGNLPAVRQREIATSVFMYTYQQQFGMEEILVQQQH